MTGKELYDSLVDLSKEAHAAGQYEAAYHALAAAMHVAEARLGEDELRDVAELALSHLSAVDTVAPGHRMSTAGAQARPGGVNLYAQLSRQAQAQISLARMRHLQAERELAQPGGHPPTSERTA